MELQKKAKFSKKKTKKLSDGGKKLNAELSCPLPINSWPLGRRFRVYGRANVALLEKIFLLTFICMRKTKKKKMLFQTFIICGFLNGVMMTVTPMLHLLQSRYDTVYKNS